jgi:hypothetical protein
MKKKFLNLNTKEVIHGEFLKVRGVFDLIDPKIAQVEMQFITDDGAVSVWADFEYKDSWTDDDIKSFADMQLSLMTLDS